MPQSTQPTKLLIKRQRNRHAQAHGGAWKIAYADFVTAMMAFFLLMWLLGMVNVSKLKGVADYFQTPLFDQKSTVVIPPPTASKPKPMLELQKKVQQVMATNPALVGLGPQVVVETTTDGLRIQLLDTQDKPMFERGGIRLQPYARELLQALAGVLNDADLRLVISGYTDALPYASGERGYSNWELSSDRAHAARRELIAGHLRETLVERVEGLGSSQPWLAADPLDPRNRRISLWARSK